MSNILLIMQREFNERARKKSFILTTVLMPVLMIGLMVVPALIMAYATGDEKEVVVIDDSHLIASKLQDTPSLKFTPSDLQIDEARSLMTDKFGILHIGSGIMTDQSDIRLYANSSSSMNIENEIRRQIQDYIESEKLKGYNIENLETILEEVKSPVTMQIFRNDKSQEEDTQAQSTAAASAIGYILGFLLYMFILLYGSLVMQAVIEEKSSRVMEVLVSSVRPFDLMMGKILGVASIALTQLLIWAVLILGVGSMIIPMFMPDDIMQGVEAVHQGGSAEMIAMSANLDTDMLQAVTTATDTAYLAKIFLFLALFLLGGYLFYSSMFAAVGSAVDNVQDSTQLQTPITLPIILSLIISLVVMNDPNSSVAFWFSIIPFTSPIVMMARIPYEIPMWEIILSLVLLYMSFVVMVWFASKIYRVGVLMYGKKPGFKELLKWVKYKY